LLTEARRFRQKKQNEIASAWNFPRSLFVVSVVIG